MTDYIPRKDGNLTKWLANFAATLEAHAAEFGVPEDQIALLYEQCAAYTGDVDDYVRKRTAALAACRTKAKSRTSAESTARFLAQWIGHHPAMDNGLRTELGLRPKNMEDAPTPIEQLVPIIHLESHLGTVTVHWGPNPMNERFNGKPKGVHTAAIFRKKTGEEEYRLVGYTTKSPYRDTIKGPAAEYSYIVRYRGRKVNKLSMQSQPAIIAACGVLEKPAA